MIMQLYLFKHSEQVHAVIWFQACAFYKLEVALKPLKLSLVDVLGPAGDVYALGLYCEIGIAAFLQKVAVCKQYLRLVSCRYVLV